MENVIQAVKKGSKLTLSHALYLLPGLALILTGGGIGCRGSSASAGEEGKSSSAVKSVLHLEPFVVNLSDPEDNRFLRVGIDLGLENPLPKESKGREIPISRIRDCILTVLSTWRSDALLAPDGKEKLKNELVEALHDRTPELGVSEIYFTDFLVQR